MDQRPQPFAIFQRRPQVRGDVSHAPAFAQQLQPALDKGQVQVEIARSRRLIGAGRRRQPARHVGIDLHEVLQLHIGWVADHRVERAEREVALPVKGVDPVAFFRIVQSLPLVEIVVDQAVAACDVAVERRQRPVRLRRMQPQRQARDLDRCRVDVDAQ